MLKTMYKLDGWTATSAIVRDMRIEVKLSFALRYNFCCPKCHTLLKTHRKREICVRDLPILDKNVLLFVDTMQGFCVACKRFYTLRPSICHPSFGYTWRLMRTLSRLLVQTSARFLEDVYAIPRSSLLRIDREVLRHDIPKPPLDHLQGVLIDEKYVGARKGFVTLALNARTGEPLEMSRSRDSKCLDAFFARFSDEQKKQIKYLGIDRSNAYKAAVLQHIPHIQVCYDAYHLVSNMNDVLDEIRRFIMKNPSDDLRCLMKGKRFILLKGREKIGQDARADLRE